MPARAPNAASAPATLPVQVDVALAGEIARAAKRFGLSQGALIEDALRLALELGPEGVAQTRKALALDSAKRPAKAS